MVMNNQTYRQLIYTLLGAIQAVILAYSFLYQSISIWDAVLFSTRSLLTPESRKKDTRIVLVLFDEMTLKRYSISPSSGKFPALKEVNIAITHVLKGRPEVVGVQIAYSIDTIDDEDISMLRLLDKASSAIVINVNPGRATKHATKNSQVNQSNGFTFKNIRLANQCTIQGSPSGETISTDVVMGDDGVEYRPFPVVISEIFLGRHIEDSKLSGYGFIGKVLDSNFPSHEMLINYVGGLDYFDSISFAKVLDTDPKYFKNKIVLFGVSADSYKDFYETILSPKTPGIVVHANAIHTIINNHLIRGIDSQGIRAFITFILCLILVALSPNKGIAKISLVLILEALLYLVISHYIFKVWSFYLQVCPVIFSLILTYCFIVLYKFINGKLIKKHQQKQQKIPASSLDT